MFTPRTESLASFQLDFLDASTSTVHAGTERVGSFARNALAWRFLAELF